jgi:ppGpp synthetase/RelA/SpoT-type nucleotidyltranferase
MAVRSRESDAEPPMPGLRYELWLATRHKITNLDSHRNHYETVSKELLVSFCQSAFWKEVIRELPNIDAEYAIANRFPLVTTYHPTIIPKPWSSFLDKSYRKNIAENPEFPNPPTGGWCLPPDWFSQIHDIIRTTIIVKYIDGVPLVLDKLQRIADVAGLKSDAQLEARETGYYGAHFNLKKECEISTMVWSKETRVVEFEIQITTQIKEVISRLLHTYYESQRLSGRKATLADISWNYQDDEFVATYLGHILHYVEGMIIDARNRRSS